MTTIKAQPFFDTNGKKIQAHGGAVFFENGVYYWYGENKEFTTGKSEVWTYGIKCYSSKNLCDWKDEGFLIPPSKDKSSWLHPSKFIDRPHIVRSAKTGKYVCWIKYSGNNEACFCVFEADSLLGNYQLVKQAFRPFDKEVGDFDIYTAPDGQGYLYFTNGHNGVVACKLNAECTDVEGDCKVYYSGMCVPYCREGISMVEHSGRLFMLSSGMTGYIPNPSEVAYLSSPLGEMTILGNPHIGDESGASFHSQISYVFKIDGKDRYIAMADRWIPKLKFTAKKNEKMMRALASCIDRKRYKSTLFEKAALGKYPWNCKKVNTSLSEYVWLPVTFENGTPEIRWTDCFSVEEL